MSFPRRRDRPADSDTRIKKICRGAINRAPTPHHANRVKMTSRYTRPPMGRLWTEDNSFQKWLDVEILAAEGLARLGKVPKVAIARIRKKARLDVKRIRAIEAEVKHETIAFLSAVAETVGDDARYLHLGMTS